MDLAGEKALQRKTINVAICGNPNCGKTTIFNAITGLRQKVANYPGVTVEKTSGLFQVKSNPSTTFKLTDIPGSYSLAAFSPDEYVAVQALLGSIDADSCPDVIISVIDVTHLERGFYLLFQIIEIGKPVVVALNMMDLAERRGMHIDIDRLSHELGGIPVVPVVGSRGKGIEELKAAVAEAAAAQKVSEKRFYHSTIVEAASELMAVMQNGHRTKAEYLRILLDVHGPAEKAFLKEGGETGRQSLQQTRARLVQEFGTLTNAETQALAHRAAEICSRTVATTRMGSKAFSEKLDRYLLHPVLGPTILVLVMGFMFQSIFAWAEPVMNAIDGIFSALAGIVEGAIPAGPLQSLMVDGIIGGVGSVLVFLPQIIILFLFISFLEDSGYMPRVAFLVDRAFSWCGLSGKSFIPLLSSFACAVPGIMATRVIEDRKLRIITVLVAPLMTCSARLPVYAIMIAAFIPHVVILGILNSHGLLLGSLYFLGLLVAVIVSLLLKKTFLQTQRGTFMMEMPSYKLPTLSSVLIRVFNRAKSFVLRAGTTILAITIIIWALSYYPRSEAVLQKYDAHIAAVAEQHAQDASLISQELDRVSASRADGLAVREQIEARFAVAMTDEDLLEARNELTVAYADNSDMVELAHLQRLSEIDMERRTVELSNDQAGEQLRNSYLGRMGQAVEPMFRPLGWDWKITMATLASFPAREVIIATLGTIYNLGSDQDEESSTLVGKMREARWEDGPKVGEKVFSPAVALSVIVFFALCCQCGATVVTIKQETGAWRYAVGVFVYMTILAYVSALVVYQLLSRMGW